MAGIKIGSNIPKDKKREQQTSSVQQKELGQNSIGYKINVKKQETSDRLDLKENSPTVTPTDTTIKTPDLPTIQPPTIKTVSEQPIQPKTEPVPNPTRKKYTIIIPADE